MTAAAHFDVVDYSIFILSLCLSLSIGVYFGYTSRKQQTAANYLYGNRQMKSIPTGLSLYSSAWSAISIIGAPYEFYNFGIQYLVTILGVILGMFAIWHTVLPVFCGNLNINTPYEYFERRFNYRIRIMSTCMHLLHTVLLMPVILYAPAVAMSLVMRIPVFICTILIGGVCILYTTIGGFRSVIWTDSLQGTLMLLSCLIIAVVGVGKAGGFVQVWTRAQESDILHLFNMDPNPLIRITFWAATLGELFTYICHAGCSASALQRYMSVPGEKEARISTVIGMLGTVTIRMITAVIGLSMFSIYYKCDPKLNGEINSESEITSYFVTQTIRNFPGFNGFFMAGLLSATFSTLSSELNTLGGLIYYDIILKFFKNQFIVNQGPTVMKIIISVIGLIYLCIASFIQSSHIYQVAFAISGITYGAKLAILMVGLFVPKINTKALKCGIVASISIMIWIYIGATRSNIISYFQIQHSTENCPVSNITASIMTNLTVTTTPANITTLITTSSHNLQILQIPKYEDIFFLYRVSFLYYTFIGTIITVLVAIVASYFVGTADVNKIDPLLMSPFVRTYLQKQQYRAKEMTEMFNEKNTSESPTTVN